MTSQASETESPAPEEKERARPDARAPALFADLTRRTFLANLRHELRTPINAILGYSEMLSEDATAQGQEDLASDLQKIHAAGSQLLARVNDVLDPAKIEAGQLDVALEAFGAHLRHELRTPINAVVGYTEMLLEDAADRGRGNLIPDLQKVHSAAERFVALIDDIVNFTRIQTGEREADLKTSDTSAMIQDVVSALRPLASAPAEAALAEHGLVLIVDDNEINRDVLSRHLERQGHRAMTAANGRQALEMVAAQKFDLVLLDVMMPEMNGFETLQRLKADATWRDIPVIMVSALDEIDSIVRCIEMGAEDYLPKPFNPVLLKARIGASLEKKRLRDQEQLYLKGLERELEIGRQIQASFLPDVLPQPPGWEIAARFQAARQVAGDFYDAFTLAREEKIGLVIADVCDKGVGAALFMALFRSLIRATSNLDYFTGGVDLPSTALDSSAERRQALSNSAANLKNTVVLANNYIARVHRQANMFTTLFFGVLDPATGSLIYVNGGHEAPILLGPAGVKAYLTRTGPAVGLLPDVDFKIQETHLEPGDTLLAFTDGVTDAKSPGDEFFTEERLLALLERPVLSAAALLDHIEASLRTHVAGAAQFDDITLLAVRRAPVPNA